MVLSSVAMGLLRSAEATQVRVRSRTPITHAPAMFSASGRFDVRRANVSDHATTAVVTLLHGHAAAR
ncbi:MAG: hypothetical protein IRY90_05710 [Actinomadura rubrobrunea]|nr:hypothetical protein [Actinomadura rubrobrunea]